MPLVIQSSVPLFCLTLLLLTACSNSVPTQFYTLDAILASNLPQSTATQTIGVGPITLPALLNRRAIVIRDNQSLHIDDSQQWAEPLLDNVSRVISRNLSSLKPHALIHTYPWSAFGVVDTRIVIEVTRFEVQRNQGVYWDAVWRIKNEPKDTLVSQGQSHLMQPLRGQTTADIVQATNVLLGHFSQELSLALP